jgi:hypothetical protein
VIVDSARVVLRGPFACVSEAAGEWQGRAAGEYLRAVDEAGKQRMLTGARWARRSACWRRRSRAPYLPGEPAGFLCTSGDVLGPAWLPGRAPIDHGGGAMHPDEDQIATPDEHLAKELDGGREQAKREAEQHEMAATAWRRKQAMCEAGLAVLKEQTAMAEDAEAKAVARAFDPEQPIAAS